MLPAVRKLAVIWVLAGAMTSSVRGEIEDASTGREVSLARKAGVQELRQKLESADALEAKRAVVEQYRAKGEQVLVERKASQPEVPTKAPQELIAELKSGAGNDPTMLKRIKDLEQRLNFIEKLKQKLTALEVEDAEEKRALVEEFRSEQRNLAQQREQEVEAQRTQAGASPQELPPAMQAIRAKAEERKQEIETLKAALEQAQPQERVELKDAFWEKQKVVPAERQQELEFKRSEQSPGEAAQP